MDKIADLVRLVLENTWRIGLFLLIFSGASFLAPRFNISLPQLVTDWNAAGLLAGAAILATAGVSSATGWIRGAHSRRAYARQTAREETAAALANLALLDEDEREALAQLLESGAPRFPVYTLSIEWELLRKGILVPVRNIGGSASACEIQPAILAHKDQILATIPRQKAAPRRRLQ